MNVLIVGSKGQLGVALQEAAPTSAKVFSEDLPEFDIVDASVVISKCRSYKPDVIFNAAAYTAVDRAETDHEKAQAINVVGVRNLAEAASQVEARLFHVSTDFVFDGTSVSPYLPDDETSPVSVYGRTKRDGENAVTELLPKSGVIVRTAWLYSDVGDNFVKTMLRLMLDRDEIDVVADQVGTPTWATSLARTLWELAGVPDLYGLFHWTDDGQATWHEFALAVQETAFALGILETKIPIHAISTKDYPTPAQRPRYSVLDCSKTQTVLGCRPQDWRVNLDQMLKGMVT